MKKSISTLLLVLLTLTTSACAQNKQSEMCIRPGNFSTDTLELLDWFDEEMEIFDVSFDDTVKSYTMSVWVYQDGAWTEQGNTCENIDCSQGKIALKLAETSYDLCFIDENSHLKYSVPATDTVFEKSTVTNISKIDNETPIELNKETPIWVKLGNTTSSSEIKTDFRNTKCDEGIAITLTVSDKIID